MKEAAAEHPVPLPPKGLEVYGGTAAVCFAGFAFFGLLCYSVVITRRRKRCI
jgi:hypothetical protein